MLGKPLEQVMDRVGLKTKEVAERYAHRGRHQARLRKQQRLAQQGVRRVRQGQAEAGPPNRPAPLRSTTLRAQLRQLIEGYSA